MRIVESLKIRFTQPCEFNDPFDNRAVVNARSPSFLKTPTAKKIRLASLTFAILVTGCAIAQYWFIYWQTSKTAHQDFQMWADEVKRELREKGGWNLDKFRQADWSAPGAFLLTTNGLILDIEGFVPGFIGPVSLPDNLIYETPFNFTSEIGEVWRIFAKKLKGGTVILAVGATNNNPDQTDSLLRDNARIFELSVENAANVRPREVNRNVDYAVVDSSGGIRFAIGGVPMRTIRPPEAVYADTTTNIFSQGRTFRVFSTKFADSTGKTLGVISIPRDGTPEQQTLHSSVVFNVILSLFSWALLGGFSAVFFIRESRERLPHPIALDVALAKGEGQEIEFKGGIVDGKLARSIAAFANSNSGCIFIGVQDNGGVSGLRERTAEEKDQLLRKIHDIAKREIDPSVLPEADFIEYHDKMVLRLFVLKGKSPPYVVQGSVYRRFLAAVSQASANDIRSMLNSS